MSIDILSQISHRLLKTWGERREEGREEGKERRAGKGRRGEREEGKTEAGETEEGKTEAGETEAGKTDGGEKNGRSIGGNGRSGCVSRGYIFLPEASSSRLWPLRARCNSNGSFSGVQAKQGIPI